MGLVFETTFDTRFGGAISLWDAAADAKFTTYLAAKLEVSAAQISHSAPFTRRRRLSEGGWTVGTTVRSDSASDAALVEGKMRDDVTVAEIESAVGIEAQAKSGTATAQFAVSQTPPPPPPHDDDSNPHLLLLLLLLLLVILPLVYLLVVWLAHGAKAGLYLSWAWHHSNAGVPVLYMPAKDKAALAAKLWPAAAGAETSGEAGFGIEEKV